MGTPTERRTYPVIVFLLVGGVLMLTTCGCGAAESTAGAIGKKVIKKGKDIGNKVIQKGKQEIKKGKQWIDIHGPEALRNLQKKWSDIRNSPEVKDATQKMHDALHKIDGAWNSTTHMNLTVAEQKTIQQSMKGLYDKYSARLPSFHGGFLVPPKCLLAMASSQSC